MAAEHAIAEYLTASEANILIYEKMLVRDVIILAAHLARTAAGQVLDGGDGGPQAGEAEEGGASSSSICEPASAQARFCAPGGCLSVSLSLACAPAPADLSAGIDDGQRTAATATAELSQPWQRRKDMATILDPREMRTLARQALLASNRWPAVGAYQARAARNG